MRTSLLLALAWMIAAPAALVGEDLELWDLDVSGWDCLNHPGGTAKTQDGIERNRQKNRTSIDLAGSKIEPLDTSGFLKKVRAYDAVLNATRRAELSEPQKEQLASFEKQFRVFGLFGRRLPSANLQSDRK